MWWQRTPRATGEERASRASFPTSRQDVSRSAPPRLLLRAFLPPDSAPRLAYRESFRGAFVAGRRRRSATGQVRGAQHLAADGAPTTGSRLEPASAPGAGECDAHRSVRSGASQPARPAWKKRFSRTDTIRTAARPTTPPTIPHAIRNPMVLVFRPTSFAGLVPRECASTQPAWNRCSRSALPSRST